MAVVGHSSWRINAPRVDGGGASRDEPSLDNSCGVFTTDEQSVELEIDEIYEIDELKKLRPQELTLL
jgi:hypothetical protein